MRELVKAVSFVVGFVFLMGFFGPTTTWTGMGISLVVMAISYVTYQLASNKPRRRKKKAL
nr:MAG TPA: Methylamine utilization protein MauE [Caudoviricetes sp.]